MHKFGVEPHLLRCFLQFVSGCSSSNKAELDIHALITHKLCGMQGILKILRTTESPGVEHTQRIFFSLMPPTDVRLRGKNVSNCFDRWGVYVIGSELFSKILCGHDDRSRPFVHEVEHMVSQRRDELKRPFGKDLLAERYPSCSGIPLIGIFEQFRPSITQIDDVRSAKTL